MSSLHKFIIHAVTVRHPYMSHTLAAEPLLAVGLNNDSRRGRIPVEWREVPGGCGIPPEHKLEAVLTTEHEGTKVKRY